MSTQPAAGYSGTPLDHKLGLNPGQRILFESAPDDGWVEVPEGATVLRRPAADLDVTEDVVRELALSGDLVDATWSGLKLVIRKEAR